MLVAITTQASPSARLVYARSPAATACPDEAALRDAMRRRVGYDPFFPWAKTTVVVEVTGRAQSFEAHVSLVDEAGVTRGTRALSSGPAGCPGLIDATALAISIALDTLAPPAPDPAPAPAPEPAPLPPVRVHARARAAPARELEPTPEPAPSPPPLRASLGLDTIASFGSTPRPVAGLALWAAIRRGVGSLDADLRADAPDDAPFAHGGQAAILVLAATLAPCAHAGPFLACALGSVEWIHAAGSGVEVTQSGSALVVAVGPRAGLELGLNDALALRVHGDMLVNTLRPAVSLDGATWSVPPIGGVAAVGLVYRFP